MTHTPKIDAMIDANWQEQVKNDRVHAAAPEMLAALKSAEWWLENTGGLADQNSDTLAEIKAAIAKAEGR
jgi:hypothetical protein